LVFLGANEIKNAKESGQVRLMVPSSNFHIYPTWNPKRLKDDIAIVRLPHAVSFNGESHILKFKFKIPDALFEVLIQYTIVN